MWPEQHLYATLALLSLASIAVAVVALDYERIRATVRRRFA